MEKDLENLNLELIQAQILLRASHDLFKEIILEITRRKVSGRSGNEDNFGQGTGTRIAKFTQRDEEIRRLLVRLEKLGKPTERVA